MCESRGGPELNGLMKETVLGTFVVQERPARGLSLLFRSKLGKFCVLMAVAIFVSWYHGIPFLVQIHSEFARFRREFRTSDPRSRSRLRTQTCVFCLLHRWIATRSGVTGLHRGEDVLLAVQYGFVPDRVHCPRACVTDEDV